MFDEQSQNALVNSRVRQFDLEHGDYVRVNYWLYFADGANRDQNALGPLISVPTDPIKLWQNIGIYRAEVLRRAVAKFEDRKKELEQRAAAAIRFASAKAPPPAPSADDLAQLKALGKTVRQLQAALTAAQRELQKATDATKPHIDQAAITARTSRATAAQTALDEINI